jgi:hypothetical protein
MTYEQIKQRVYDQLKLPETEVKRLGYAAQIPRLLNAALFRIANSILPNLREYVIKVHVDKLPARITMPPDFIAFADEQAAYLNGRPFTLTKFIGTADIIIDGSEVNNVLSDILEYHIFYNADYPRIRDSALMWTSVKLSVDKIDSDNYTVEDVPVGEYNIPDVAAMAVPHYIAGHLLSLDDKVRSVEELNEFEILLSTVSTARHERTREFHSSRGWY